MRATLLLLLCASCTKQTLLADLPSKVLSVNVSATGGFGVELRYDDSARCVNVGGEVKAKLNGETLELFTAGTQSVSTEGQSCDFPLWESGSDTNEPALANFSLQDSSLTIAASFDALFVARGYALTTAPTASVGDMVALSWAPLSDDYDPAKLEIIFAPKSGTGGIVAKGTDITVGGGTLSFTLPPGTAAGAGNLLVSGDANAHVATCTGADKCEATFQVAQLIPFTVN